jgi:RND family efflux transporter MFP subunit
VATLADLSQLEVDTDVKEDYLNHLRKGQPAEVVVDAVTNRRYRGQLREIIPMGDRTRGIVKVKVSVLDADERLFPELSATVHFLPEEDGESAGGSKKAVFAPAAAVVRDGEQDFVWTIDEDRAYRVPVTTLGEPRDGSIQIERGLSGGETVIVNPPSLENGVRVQAAE